MKRTHLLVVGALLTVVGCDETLLEDGGETCLSGVSWTGVELETQGSELRVRACVEDICVRRSVAIVEGNNCGTRIEAQGDAPSSARAFRQQGTVHLILHLDLTLVAQQLRQADEGFLEVTSPSGELLFRSENRLTYVGGMDGKKPCRRAEVDVRGGDANSSHSNSRDASRGDANSGDAGGSDANSGMRGSDAGS